jgi:hypothetical protein
MFKFEAANDGQGISSRVHIYEDHEIMKIVNTNIVLHIYRHKIPWQSFFIYINYVGYVRYCIVNSLLLNPTPHQPKTRPSVKKVNLE